MKGLRAYDIPPPPAWLEGLPLAGPRLASEWREAAAQGIEVITPYASDVTRWFVAQLGNFGALFLQLLLTIIASAVLYAYGEDVPTGRFASAAASAASAAQRRCVSRAKRSAAWRAAWSSPRLCKP